MAQRVNNPLYNLRLLRVDMIKRGWVIDAFMFRYKIRKYVVLIKLFGAYEIKPKYSLVKLEFVREDDINISLKVDANVNGLNIDAQTLRTFFGIEFSFNLGEIFTQFYSVFGGQIPIQVNEKKTHIEKISISKTVNKDESEIDKIYCFLVRRNPRRKDGKLGQRSRQNEELAKALYPDVFIKLKDDPSLSFCFSANPKAEKSSEELLMRWIEFSDRGYEKNIDLISNLRK